uniref:Uncharacterized protein n=1 Tax=Rhipicephalus microplus TaxID=6941 RepID=A0A6G5AGY4_RHIMP
MKRKKINLSLCIILWFVFCFKRILKASCTLYSKHYNRFATVKTFFTPSHATIYVRLLCINISKRKSQFSSSYVMAYFWLSFYFLLSKTNWSAKYILIALFAMFKRLAKFLKFIFTVIFTK